MSRALPQDYVPSKDELIAGRVWVAALELNRIAREASECGISVSFTLGFDQGTAGVPAQVFVDTIQKARVLPVWFVDADGKPLSPDTAAIGNEGVRPHTPQVGERP